MPTQTVDTEEGQQQEQVPTRTVEAEEASQLKEISNYSWFYEFNLPDGTKTASYLPPHVKKIHETREQVLRNHIESCTFPRNSALDIACHEGFFSLVLKEYFATVVGIDKNEASIHQAKLMTRVQKKDIQYIHSAFEDISDDLKSDFVLCYGLLYHIDNPMTILPKLAGLTRHALCIETQVLPFTLNGYIEDGFYDNQREIKGLFGLCADYPTSNEGGTTEYALVPSLNALTYLLHQFGFKSVQVYEPKEGDYEQFVRRHRVIIFAEKDTEEDNKPTA